MHIVFLLNTVKKIELMYYVPPAIFLIASCLLGTPLDDSLLRALEVREI